MRYKVGEKVVLRDDLKEVVEKYRGSEVLIKLVNEPGWYVTTLKAIKGSFRFLFTDDHIDHEKTVELHKQNTLNHYVDELERVVAAKNKIHSHDAVETKFMNDKFDRHKELTDYMHQTYIRKNKDYGDSFSRVHREIGWQSSLGDIAHKFYRLQNLMQNKGEHHVEDETTIDTLIDLANYSLLLAMELEDE